MLALKMTKEVRSMGYLMESLSSGLTRLLMANSRVDLSILRSLRSSRRLLDSFSHHSCPPCISKIIRIEVRLINVHIIASNDIIGFPNRNPPRLPHLLGHSNLACHPHLRPHVPLSPLRFCEPCIKSKFFSLVRQACPLCRKPIACDLDLFAVNVVIDEILAGKYGHEKV